MSIANDRVEAVMEDKPAPAKRPYAFVIKILPGVVLALDCAALLGVGFASYFALVYYQYQTVDFYTLAIVGNSMLSLMLMYFAGLYQFGALTHPVRAVDRIVLATLTSFILMLAAAFTIKISDIYSRFWVAAYIATGTGVVILLRLLVAWGIGKLGERRIVARNVAIFGFGEQIEQLLRFMEERRPAFVTIAGIFGGSQAKHTNGKSKSREKMSENELTRLIEFVRKDGVDDVIVAVPWEQAKVVAEIMEKLRELPVNVFLSSDLIGYKMAMRSPPSYFESLPLHQVAGKPLTGWDIVLKMLEDYVISICLIVLLSPLLLLVALLIKLDSPGPVIFKQKRLGFNNQVFDIYKFRSMTFAPHQNGPTVQAKQHDPRVTRVGRILRKSSIDEIPQLFNVLNGTMSIVGPRPHAIDHNEEFATKIRGYFSRHRVKPGLTGLAQVKGFRGLTDTVEKMENRVKYDVEYTENWSLILDIKIILRTPFAVLLGTNAH
jgi:putative colanic acid biosysnthesis UDP-glucose lipid carrier transferase